MRCGAADSTSITARATLFHARSSTRHVTLVAVRLSTLRMSNPPVLIRKFRSPSRRAARDGKFSRRNASYFARSPELNALSQERSCRSAGDAVI